jgi:hypothetical protein
MISKEINRLLEALNWAYKDLITKNNTLDEMRKRKKLAPLRNVYEIKKLDEARQNTLKHLEIFRDVHNKVSADIDKWEKQTL